MMPAQPPDFQDFQHAFARHLRDPHHVARPDGIPQRRTAVYSELVFNNLCGFLDACFPICQQLLGKQRWRRLNRTFCRDWPLHTPWFREIPREFVRYLGAADIRQPLPPWFAELAHHEWTELAVDTMEAAAPACDPGGDLLEQTIVLNPALMNLEYAWPVHSISADFRPRKPRPTHLLVYRDGDDAVRFSEVSPVTARLIALLAAAPATGRQAIARIAAELQHPDPSQLLGFGRELLADLQRQGIILGSTP